MVVGCIQAREDVKCSLMELNVVNAKQAPSSQLSLWVKEGVPLVWTRGQWVGLTLSIHSDHLVLWTVKRHDVIFSRPPLPPFFW